MSFRAPIRTLSRFFPSAQRAFLTSRSIGDLLVRVKAYGGDPFPLSSIARISETATGGGYEVRPFDRHILPGIADGLFAESFKHGLKVEVDAKGKIFLFPKKQNRNSWTLVSTEDDDLNDQLEDDEYSLVPRSDRIRRHVSKPWVHTDVRKAVKRLSSKPSLRASTVKAALVGLDDDHRLASRLLRAVDSNQKLSQLIDRATRSVFSRLVSDTKLSPS
jgi:hypothetical protein